MKCFVVFATVVYASTLTAGVARIQPSNPTTTDVIVITATTFYADLVLQPVVVTGFEIQITFRGHPTVPAGGGGDVRVGPLPAGTYTIVVRHVLEDGAGGSEIIADPPVTFTVIQAAAIPALDPVALAALIGCLATVAALALRRI